MNGASLNPRNSSFAKMKKDSRRDSRSQRSHVSSSSPISPLHILERNLKSREGTKDGASNASDMSHSGDLQPIRFLKPTIIPDSSSEEDIPKPPTNPPIQDLTVEVEASPKRPQNRHYSSSQIPSATFGVVTWPNIFGNTLSQRDISEGPSRLLSVLQQSGFNIHGSAKRLKNRRQLRQSLIDREETSHSRPSLITSSILSNHGRPHLEERSRKLIDESTPLEIGESSVADRHRFRKDTVTSSTKPLVLSEPVLILDSDEEAAATAATINSPVTSVSTVTTDSVVSTTTSIPTVATVATTTSSPALPIPTSTDTDDIHFVETTSKEDTDTADTMTIPERRSRRRSKSSLSVHPVQRIDYGIDIRTPSPASLPHEDDLSGFDHRSKSSLLSHMSSDNTDAEGVKLGSETKLDSLSSTQRSSSSSIIRPCIVDCSKGRKEADDHYQLKESEKRETVDTYDESEETASSVGLERRLIGVMKRNCASPVSQLSRQSSGNSNASDNRGRKPSVLATRGVEHLLPETPAPLVVKEKKKRGRKPKSKPVNVEEIEKIVKVKKKHGQRVKKIDKSIQKEVERPRVPVAEKPVEPVIQFELPATSTVPKITVLGKHQADVRELAHLKEEIMNVLPRKRGRPATKVSQFAAEPVRKRQKNSANPIYIARRGRKKGSINKTRKIVSQRTKAEKVVCCLQARCCTASGCVHGNNHTKDGKLPSLPETSDDIFYQQQYYEDITIIKEKWMAQVAKRGTDEESPPLQEAIIEIVEPISSEQKHIGFTVPVLSALKRDPLPPHKFPECQTPSDDQLHRPKIVQDEVFPKGANNHLLSQLRPKSPPPKTPKNHSRESFGIRSTVPSRKFLDPPATTDWLKVLTSLDTWKKIPEIAVFFENCSENKIIHDECFDESTIEAAETKTVPPKQTSDLCESISNTDLLLGDTKTSSLINGLFSNPDIISSAPARNSKKSDAQSDKNKSVDRQRSVTPTETCDIKVDVPRLTKANLSKLENSDKSMYVLSPIMNYMAPPRKLSKDSSILSSLGMSKSRDKSKNDSMKRKRGGKETTPDKKKKKKGRWSLHDDIGSGTSNDNQSAIIGHKARSGILSSFGRRTVNGEEKIVESWLRLEPQTNEEKQDEVARDGADEEARDGADEATRDGSDAATLDGADEATQDGADETDEDKQDEAHDEKEDDSHSLNSCTTQINTPNHSPIEEILEISNNEDLSSAAEKGQSERHTLNDNSESLDSTKSVDDSMKESSGSFLKESSSSGIGSEKKENSFEVGGESTRDADVFVETSKSGGKGGEPKGERDGDYDDEALELDYEDAEFDAELDEEPNVKDQKAAPSPVKSPEKVLQTTLPKTTPPIKPPPKNPPVEIPLSNSPQRAPLFAPPRIVPRVNPTMPGSMPHHLPYAPTSDLYQMSNFDRFASQTYREFDDQYSRPDEADQHDPDDAYDPYAPVHQTIERNFFPKDPRLFFRGLCYSFLKSGKCNRIDCTFHNVKYTIHLQKLPKAPSPVIEMVLNHAIGEGYYHLLLEIYPEAIKGLELRGIERVCRKIYMQAQKLKTKASNYSAEFYRRAMQPTVDALTSKGYTPLTIIDILCGCYLFPNDDDRKKLMRTLIATKQIVPGSHWDTFRGLICQLDGAPPEFMVKLILEDCMRFEKPREYLADIYENLIKRIAHPVMVGLSVGLFRPFREFMGDSERVQRPEQIDRNLRIESRDENWGSDAGDTPVPEVAQDFTEDLTIRNFETIASPDNSRDSGRFEQEMNCVQETGTRKLSVKERLGVKFTPRNARAQESFEAIPIGETGLASRLQFTRNIFGLSIATLKPSKQV